MARLTGPENIGPERTLPGLLVPVPVNSPRHITLGNTRKIRPHPDRENDSLKGCGGEGGIRTHGTREGSTVFETAPFDHSGTSPRFGVVRAAFTGAAGEAQGGFRRLRLTHPEPVAMYRDVDCNRTSADTVHGRTARRHGGRISPSSPVASPPCGVAAARAQLRMNRSDISAHSSRRHCRGGGME